MSQSVGAASAANCRDIAVYAIPHLPHDHEMWRRKHHGKDLRKYRHSENGQVYLVTTNCLARKPIFENMDLGYIVADEIRRSDELSITHTYAYVVMPDHLHWLFQMQYHSLPSIIRSVKGRSARRINKRQNQSGAIWQPGYHDRALKTDESLEDVGDYVVANPVRGGLVTDIEKYPLWDLMWRRRRANIRG